MNVNERVGFIGALLLVSIFGAIAAEKPSLPQLPAIHQKVYFDTLHQKVYWPPNKPFWLRIAETAGGSPSYPLIAGDEFTGDNAPMSCGLSGIQSIRWYNAARKDTVTVKFVCDAEAPACKLKMDSAHRFVSGICTWFGGDIKAGFTATDRLSGVEQIVVSIDDAPFKPLKEQTIAFTEEKPYSCRYYAVDRVGNVSKVESTNFCVDLTPPSTHLTGIGSTDSLFTGSQTLHLVSLDSLSGVREIRYGFDQSDHLAPVKDIVSVKGLKDGKHVLYYCATDNVGNTEKLKSFGFYIDNTAPVAEMVFDGDHFAGKGGVFISGRTTISLEAHDVFSAVDKIKYALDNKPLDVYSQPISFNALAQGVHVLSIQTSDRLGNISPVIKKTIEIDLDPPVTKIDFHGTTFRQDGIIYITPETKIILTGADAASGVRNTEWKLDDGEPEVCNGPFPIPKEGVFTLHYRSVDNVNNAENFKDILIACDNTPPQIVQTFSRRGVASPTEKDVMLFPSPTTLYLGASDSLSGVNGIWYSINGSKEARYNQELTFSAPGKYELNLKSTDNVGKTALQAMTIRIR
jgi:hypothetical protein